MGRYPLRKDKPETKQKRGRATKAKRSATTTGANERTGKMSYHPSFAPSCCPRSCPRRRAWWARGRCRRGRTARTRTRPALRPRTLRPQGGVQKRPRL